MKTEEDKKNHDTSSLIHQLASRLGEPSESLNWNANYWFSWMSCVFVMAILTYLAAAFFPGDIHLPQNLKNASYWIESSLWLSLAFLAALLTSSFSRLGALSRWKPRLAAFVMLALVTTILVNISPNAFASQIYEELHWLQGPCGFFILITGFVSALWMFYIVKKGAPVNLVKTSAWASVSVGALGSFFMHLVCTHENSAHTFIWHVAPLFLLTLMCVGVGQKALRW